MGIVINQIDFTSVNLIKEENGSHTVQFCWSLNGGYSCEYQGAYIFSLYENGKAVKNETITDESSSCKSSLKLPEISIERVYQITLEVPASAGGAKTPKLKLIVDSVIEQSGVFDGETFEIHWKTGTGKCPALLCEADGSNGIRNQYYASAAAGCLKVSSSDFSGAESIDLELSLTDKNKVQGPVSEKMRFYSAPLMILSAELGRKDGACDLRLYIKSNAELEAVNLRFAASNDIVAELKNLPVSKQEDGNFMLQTEIPGSVISYETLMHCTVCATAVCRSAESRVVNESSRIALSAPILRLEGIEGNKLKMSVGNRNLPCLAVGYELPDGSLINASSFTAPFDKNYSVSIRPRYDRNGCIRKGTWSNRVTSFLAGYYPQKDGNGTEYVHFYQNSFAEAQISRVIKEELFLTHLAGEIAQKPIYLTPLDNGYKLTIDADNPLTRETYQNFIGQIKDSITPYGFYLLCDHLLRMAPQVMEDTTYFQCAFLPERGTADVRPGLQLRLTTAVYQPQYDPNIAGAGYAAMHSQEYPVTIRKNGVYLELDRYVGAIAEYMNLSDISNQKTNVVTACGIADLLQPGVRQPYYRILYPEKLTHDYAVETPYPSDNVVLLTADNYGAILDASDAVAKNRAVINHLPITVVIFKGRSTLSLQMPVELNGCSLSVPVGSTLPQVLLQQGIYEIGACRLYRRGCDGREYPVFIQFADDPDKLALVSGDRIVCRN